MIKKGMTDDPSRLFYLSQTDAMTCYIGQSDG